MIKLRKIYDWSKNHTCDFEDLVGEVITKVEGAAKNEKEIHIYTESGYKVTLYHYQDCCEDVYVEDVCGDPDDIVDALVTRAEEAVNDEPEGDYYESATWTFYKLDTTKGDLVIRWCGQSNGYYSESVDIKVEKIN